MNRITSSLCLLFLAGSASAQPVFTDDFESGLGHWRAIAPDHAAILVEPGTGNHVLQLTPRDGDYSHVLLEAVPAGRDLRLEGRMLFPTEGDGYLGFIYNHRPQSDRSDFGVIYVKSNGSYVRVSPHYDGNPSWRLYEELRTPLESQRSISPNTWVAFRLDVHGRSATLWVGDLQEPVLSFDQAPNDSGSLGLEARPGRGDPVWVDDIRVSALAPVDSATLPPSPTARLGGWQALPATVDPQDPGLAMPELPESGWAQVAPDARGAIITGLLTQSASGDRDVVLLRSRFSTATDGRGWLAISSANRIDVWLNGSYRGTVAPEPFIWSDHLVNPAHAGARLPVDSLAGDNELVFRVYGRRFAGGGFFADFIESAPGP